MTKDGRGPHTPRPFLLRIGTNGSALAFLASGSEHIAPQPAQQQMSYRRFNDSEGSSWEAWEVHPSSVERRLNQDRRARRRESAERRAKHEVRLEIPLELRAGWLALQGRDARLRLSPIPDGWEHLTDEELCRLVMRAASRNPHHS